MKDKINIAELLKDCPKGMELDCTAFNNVKFQCADNDGIWIEYIDSDNHDRVIYLTCDGGIKIKNIETKCVIFPKGKTTWEGFHRPFKDGDILSYQCTGLRNRTIYIYRHHHTMNTSYYVALGGDLEFMVNPKEGHALSGNNTTARLATEEEKAKLFQVIKDNGYKWNAETKTLEELVELKFKVGDRIRHKTHIRQGNVVTEIKDTHYILDNELALPFISQDEYELVPNKFDITTLKPFDKVLVRNHEKNEWQPNFFNRYCKEINSFKLIGVCTPSYTQHEHFVNYCIPYKGNEHLLGTTDDCDEYFKSWE